MKKVLAILSIVALASCGNGGASSTEVKTDSTQVVDSVKQDTTVVAPTVDSTVETK